MFNDVYKTLKKMQKLEKELGRLFKTYNINTNGKGKLFEFPKTCYIIPQTKITETETRIMIDVFLPGLHMNDIKLKVSQDLIELNTNKCNEAPYKSYYAMIPMPSGIFMKSMKKLYKKGVLSLVFEKYMPQKFTEELDSLE